MKKTSALKGFLFIGFLWLTPWAGAETTETLPVTPEMTAVMSKPRYAQAKWSLLVEDVHTGEQFFPMNAETRSFTGSTRKLFSVGLALLALGEDRWFTTTVYREGSVADGTLQGNLALVAAGDLVLGGRRIDADTIQVTNMDHNDANNLGTAILSPQDPLYALDRLATEVRDSGIRRVQGDVVVDDRLFESYRVPNQNLLITPIMLNENQIDVWISPTKPGQPAVTDYRPKTAFFAVDADVVTSEPGEEDSIEFSGERLTSGVSGTGLVSGVLPVDYTAPISGQKTYVGTFRVEEPNEFARTAFIEALERNGVEVTAKSVGPNPENLLNRDDAYHSSHKVADYSSAPYREVAKLILKVSLNLGANLSLSLFGLENGERTVQGALAAEREILVQEFSLDPELFYFPTNGSGSPDSEAAPLALVKFLTQIRKTEVGEVFQHALPIMGVDGSLAGTGATLSGKGHVFAKTGTTVGPGEDGRPHLKAQCLAGYIETKNGRLVAYALMVNDAGPLEQIADVTEVFEDQAEISNLIYESL